MQFRRRLRSRIILSFLLLGTGLTGLFAISTLYLRDWLENQLIGEALTQNLEDYAESFYLDPELVGAPFEKIQGFLYSQRRFANVPMEWRDLPDGVHELVERDGEGGQRVYKLAVRKDPEYWFFLKYDTTQEQRTQHLLAIALPAAVLLFAVLSFVLGVWASSRVISPVRDLARRLRSLQETDRPTKLAPAFADDEVGELATALDEYAERLTEVVQRDREFNADVSHELRTPLAVIRGATELIQTTPDLSEKMQLRLERISRAEQQCTHLITALLMLSRSERGSGTTDVRQLAEQLAEANRIQMGGKPVEVVVEGEESALVEAPEAVLSVALGNLIGNACKYTTEGEVRIRVEPHRVIIDDTGPGISAEDAERLFERGYRGSAAGATKGGGIGLAIVRRLCDLHRWQVKLVPRDPHGATAVLDFRPPRI
ncbi:sensor histidine kinase [Alkalisalibacterium limincola]|uniref:histidine kinase n=1 Tax=Alkalisalibacterium limincola TaxID=2699169 RepID=A0A5C8KRJ4_9GAMM|nr:HAMP domain-containing sensor histidine kinase [Alkalisalibacterium limincola]TXK62555.1 HAMP domain-containing histidine kinase [Alkalisalibacterium limincola]